LDIISSIIQSTNNDEMLMSLLEKLKALLKQSYLTSSKFGKKSILTASIKRCMSSILLKLKPQAALGDKFNYETIKDVLFIEIIEERIK
jgi:hypothetical protein